MQLADVRRIFDVTSIYRIQIPANILTAVYAYRHAKRTRRCRARQHILLCNVHVDVSSLILFRIILISAFSSCSIQFDRSISASVTLCMVDFGPHVIDYVNTVQ